MNPDLQDKLTSQFPWFNIYVDCPDGWFDTIFNMLREIDDYYFDRGFEVGIVPLQLKDKYQNLRFYYGIDWDSEYYDDIYEIVEKYYNKILKGEYDGI